MDKLNFLTAGIPLQSVPRTYKTAFDTLTGMGLNGIELEFVRGVNISDSNIKEIQKFAKPQNMVLTVHAPFFVNLNSQEQEKIDASIARIIETARMAKTLNLYSIVFHAAYYMGMSKEDTYNKVKEGKNQLVISIGCTGGKHRSVAIANEIHNKLLSMGQSVFINHRDIKA